MTLIARPFSFWNVCLVWLMYRPYRVDTVCMRRLISTLIVVSSALAPSAATASQQYVLKHPRHEHCKPHYIKGYRWITKGRREVKQTICVKEYVAPKVAPKAASKLQVVVTTWDPINVENPEYTQAKAGQRFVAVELTLTNGTASTISSNANVDTTVVGTNGQVYSFALADRRGCTNFNYGDFTIAPGASETGCVVYELPEGVTVAKVQFELNGEVRSWS